MPASLTFIRFARTALAWFFAVLGTGIAPHAAALVDGEVDPNTMESPWAGVGSLTAAGGTYSGALIASNYVLTAAHVVAGRRPDEITFNLNFGGDLTHRIAVEAIHLRPEYRGAAQGLRRGGEFDIAVLKLATPAPAGVPIYGLYDDDLPQGAVLTFVGYGAGGIGTVGPTEPPQPQVKRTGGNVAECFAFVLGDENCGVDEFAGVGPKLLYVYKFDAPFGAGRGGAGRLLTGESGLAGGDSGSPAFVYIQGVWRIAAVNTFAGRESAKGRSSVYGTIGGGVLVAGENAEWIRSLIARPVARHLSLGSDQPHVPEPHTWFLLGIGVLNVAVALWRQRPRSVVRPDSPA